MAMEVVRKQRGLEVAQRTHHLVFAGPPEPVRPPLPELSPRSTAGWAC
ncbi:ESX-3 secretion system EccA3 domain protein [Mycobacterium xenopi 3993]|nr:ESX-3 secretion system EccA3 domain protein [Mycobacterium xenopi 3993]